MRLLKSWFVLSGFILPALAASAGTPIDLVKGWNLLGNSDAAPIDVAVTLGDSSKFTTVWTWNAITSKWVFYAPSMTPATLAAYAASKGYDVMTSIAPKQGYWVNASLATTLTHEATDGVLLDESDVRVGWNLVGSADNATPSQLNAAMDSRLDFVGKTITTLWAWDAPNTQWKFYAPSLDAQGGAVLSNYIAGKGYQPFAAALTPTDGYWLNVGTVSPTNNAIPIANPGSAQSVTVGSLVRLDGSASSDSNGDPLTYIWAGVTRPIGSVAELTSTTDSKTTFIADVWGTYVISLVVSDGKANSESVNIAVTAFPPAVINPLPIGAGHFVQMGVSPFVFYKVNIAPSYILASAYGCTSFRATDVDVSSGVVVGLSSDGLGVYEVDIAGGKCNLLFNAPTPMTALAVYRDRTDGLISVSAGSVITVSSDGQIYAFNREGMSMLETKLTGISGRAGIADLAGLDGIDFAPDGSIFGLKNGVLWRLNILGQGTVYGWGLIGSSDIDISEDYVLSVAGNDQLNRYKLTDLSFASRLGLNGLGGSGSVVSR